MFFTALLFFGFTSSAQNLTAPAFTFQTGRYTDGRNVVEVKTRGDLLEISAVNESLDFTFLFNPLNGAAHVKSAGDLGQAAGTWTSDNEMVFHWTLPAGRHSTYHSLAIDLTSRRLVHLTVNNFKLDTRDLRLEAALPESCESPLLR